MDARHVDVKLKMPQNIRAAAFLSLIWTAGWSSMRLSCLPLYVQARYDEGSTYPIYTNFAYRPEPES